MGGPVPFTGQPGHGLPTGNLHTLKDLNVRYVPFMLFSWPPPVKISWRRPWFSDEIPSKHRADRATAFRSRQLIASTIIANQVACTYGIPS